MTEGTGNVFADVGAAEPEEELAKAQLAGLIRDAIKRRRLTQAEARPADRPRSAPRCRRW
ncbi:MAG: XRE family transcriptional regulator [Caulobacteraceae bacterium]